MHYQRLTKTGSTEPQTPRPPKPPCSVEDCDKVSDSRGWCGMHYRRWRLNGTLDDPTPRLRREHCAVTGCDAGGKMSRGLCARHYWRLRQHGETGQAEHLIRVDAEVCEVDGCDRGRPLRRGWCSTHYQRWQQHGDASWQPPVFPDTCTVSGCDRPHASNGMCGTHDMRVRRTGSHSDPVPATPEPCSFDGCTKLTFARGWCGTHYMRWLKHGDPSITLRVVTPSLTGLCTIDSCAAPHAALGLCSSHYQQQRHAAVRETANARMRAHYQANREYYYAKGDERRGRIGSLSTEDRAISAAYRRAIANDFCAYCGAAGEHNDHVFPLAKGGSDHWWNLVRACAPCNKSKAAHCGTWFRLRRGIGVTPRSVPAVAEAG